MNDAAKLILIIITSVVGACGGVGGIIVAIGKSVFKKQLASRDELLQRRKQDEDEKRKKDNRIIVREELSPITEDITDIKHDLEIEKEGTQALLRNDLYELYDRWTKEGYAPRDVKQNFDNLYNKYHSMGKNGVMTGYHDKFMALPDEIRKHKKSGGK